MWHDAHDGWEMSSKPYRVVERCLCTRYIAPNPAHSSAHGPSLPLRMAAEYDEDHPAHLVLTHLDQLIRGKRPATDAAASLAGWLAVFGRSDRSAFLCVHETLRRDTLRDFLPFHTRQQVDLTQPHAVEWFRRLRPADRTAAVELLDKHESATEIYTDPETHAPVIRLNDADTLWTTVPRRLPTTSPLAELVVGQLVWVRTESGTLYPAPDQERQGYPWHRAGTDWPTRLATLVHVLLDDVAAVPSLAPAPAVSDSLRLFAEQTWPPNWAFTRSQLEAVRDGDPVTP
ncbi:hypothetical protein AOZ06_32070 [Kibdelosporangium phytohabitans]|uniref:Uncharacterized protein n=1 Tax=Kibdelosporangium phytohabitans TaxID=860235 RepID=A0A0N9I8D9_9PSEU|nr:hypothetical protein AOZ06_32070 [Kibdelosporangium phytohabitans]